MFKESNLIGITVKYALTITSIEVEVYAKNNCC